MRVGNNEGGGRGVAPVVGVALMLMITVLLVVSVGGLLLGFAQDDPADPKAVFLHDRCPGFQVAEFDPDDVNEFADTVLNNECALWLENGGVDSDGGDQVTTWYDQGPNGFDASQSDPDDRPDLVYDADLDREVLEFTADHSLIDDSYEEPKDTTESLTDGQYLQLDRDVDDLDLDDTTGLVVAGAVKVSSFDRGGTWTVGKAGVDGQEFSMRTCSDMELDGCQQQSPEGEWRAQHWGSADVDFSSGPASEGEWLTLVHAYDGAEEEVTIRVNGEVVARDDVDLDLSNDRDIQLGRWDRLDGEARWYFDGRIAELIVFDQTLEPDEIDLVEQYLGHTFDIDLDGPIDD